MSMATYASSYVAWDNIHGLLCFGDGIYGRVFCAQYANSVAYEGDVRRSVRDIRELLGGLQVL